MLWAGIWGPIPALRRLQLNPLLKYPSIRLVGVIVEADNDDFFRNRIFFKEGFDFGNGNFRGFVDWKTVDSGAYRGKSYGADPVFLG